MSVYSELRYANPWDAYNLVLILQENVFKTIGRDIVQRLVESSAAKQLPEVSSAANVKLTGKGSKATSKSKSKCCGS